MHAFLIIGQDENKINSEIINLAKKKLTKVMEFSLQKIDDVRSLNNMLRLSFNEPTLIVCKNIHLAGDEALNAFLKNLEEPQDNIYFALTAPSERSVLSTILSRCQVIRIDSENKQIATSDKKTVIEFLTMSKSSKLSYLDKFKDRELTIKFIENIIHYLHSQNELKDIEILIKTLTNIKKNGNISLHLTNLVVMLK